MKEEIDARSLLLIETNLELRERLKESNKGLCNLIRRLAKEGVPIKLLANHCGLSKTKVRRILRGKNPKHTYI